MAADPPPLRPLLDRRLVLVTGKGGTGKTTLSAALGQLQAQRGLRTLVVEVDSYRPALTAMLGTVPGYHPVGVAPLLDIANVTWREALEEWLEQTVPVQRIVRLILGNRIVQLFLDATPGVRETVILSRIQTLIRDYDRVIVDMPASGHALSLLQVPHIARSLIRAGPIREKADELLVLLADPSTQLVIVGLPEDMVVNETVELWDKLRAAVPELQTPLVVLNRAAMPTLTEAERCLLERLGALQGSAAAELVLAGRWEASLEQATADAVSRLQQEIGVPPAQIQRLGALGGFDGGAREVVRQATAALARQALAEVRS